MTAMLSPMTARDSLLQHTCMLVLLGAAYSVLVETRDPKH